MISMPPTDKSIDGKRVLITGAGGFIGSHLMHAFVHLGANVLGIDRDMAQFDKCWKPEGRSAGEPKSSDETHLVEEGCRFPPAIRTLDLSSVDDTVALFEDFRPQYVYHLASAADAQEGFDQVTPSISGGIGLTVNVLEAFRQFPGELFVFADTSKVYGDPGVSYDASLTENPLSSYAIAKSAAWQFCKYHHRLYGSNVVSMRPTIIYGPGQPKNLIAYVIDELLHGRTTIKLLGGEQTRDPLHCDDLIRAYLSMPRHVDEISGRVINVGGGNEISIADLVHKIADLMDTKVEVQIDQSQIRPTDSMRSFCNNDDARRWLDWSPEIDLETGLLALIEANTES